MLNKFERRLMEEREDLLRSKRIGADRKFNWRLFVTFVSLCVVYGVLVWGGIKLGSRLWH